MSHLQIIGLEAEIGGKKVLNGINLEVNSGEVHALMGPNGAGKSTFANVLLGHPSYKITAGKILIDDKDITDLPTFAKASAGLFLLPQDPPELPGVTVEDLLQAVSAQSLSYKSTTKNVASEIAGYAKDLGISQALLERGVNVGGSGGEKKRMEALQLAVLKPRFAVLDELDSGLDVDALKKVATAVALLVEGDSGQNAGLSPETKVGVVVVTHYQRILEYLPADKVHVLVGGKIVASGDRSLVKEIERDGYKNWS